jgi:hypothetical protein
MEPWLRIIEQDSEQDVNKVLEETKQEVTWMKKNIGSGVITDEGLYKDVLHHNAKLPTTFGQVATHRKPIQREEREEIEPLDWCPFLICRIVFYTNLTMPTETYIPIMPKSV